MPTPTRIRMRARSTAPDAPPSMAHAKSKYGQDDSKGAPWFGRCELPPSITRPANGSKRVPEWSQIQHCVGSRAKLASRVPLFEWMYKIPDNPHFRSAE